MTKKIKMIWDFRGPNAIHTAKHHVIHLKEYIEMENLTHFGCDTTEDGEFSATAYLIVTEDLVPALRAALKPHRGQLAN